MNKSALALAALAAAFTATAATAQSVIYREIFGRNTASGVALNNFGWSVYSGSGATNQSASATQYNVTGDATPTNYANVNSLPAVNSIFPGDVYTSVSNGRTLLGGSGIFVAYTEEYVIDRSLYNVTSFSWDSRNDNPAIGVTVQIGGAWYVSNLLPAGPGGTTWPTTAKSAELNFETATWSALNFTPGTTLSVGSTTTLPSGNITAFGVYAPSARGTAGVRIDGFTVEAVAIPEPSSVAALAGATALGSVVLRRRGRPAAR